MGDGFSRAMLELFGFLGKLSLASIAGSCVMVLIPLVLLLPKVERNTENFSLTKIALIIFISIFGGLFVLNVLINLLV